MVVCNRFIIVIKRLETTRSKDGIILASLLIFYML